jgi:hypothetical protein
LEKPRLRWEDNIEVDLKEIVSESVDWIYLAQDKKKVVPCYEALIYIGAQ